MISMASKSLSQTNMKIGIIGSETLGQNWAILFAYAGHRVCIFDPNQSHVVTVFTEIQKLLKHLEKDGVTRGNLNQDEILKNITVTSSLTDCVMDSVYIQECLHDDVSLKVKMLKKVDDLMGYETIVGNSGMILPSLLSRDLINRHRFLTVHSVDPINYTTCVELVPAPWTSPESCDMTSSLMIEIGQSPVKLVREVEGFAAFSIESAIFEAAYQLIKEGYCDVNDVETGMKEGMYVVLVYGDVRYATHQSKWMVRFLHKSR